MSTRSITTRSHCERLTSGVSRALCLSGCLLWQTVQRLMNSRTSSRLMPLNKRLQLSQVLSMPMWPVCCGPVWHSSITAGSWLNGTQRRLLKSAGATEVLTDIAGIASSIVGGLFQRHCPYKHNTMAQSERIIAWQSLKRHRWTYKQSPSQRTASIEAIIDELCHRDTERQIVARELCSSLLNLQRLDSGRNSRPEVAAAARQDARLLYTKYFPGAGEHEDDWMSDAHGEEKYPDSDDDAASAGSQSQEPFVHAYLTQRQRLEQERAERERRGEVDEYDVVRLPLPGGYSAAHVPVHGQPVDPAHLAAMGVGPAGAGEPVFGDEDVAETLVYHLPQPPRRRPRRTPVFTVNAAQDEATDPVHGGVDADREVQGGRLKRPRQRARRT